MEIEEYLKVSEFIDWQHPEIMIHDFEAQHFELFTAHKSDRNIRFCE